MPTQEQINEKLKINSEWHGLGSYKRTVKITDVVLAKFNPNLVRVDKVIAIVVWFVDTETHIYSCLTEYDFLRTFELPVEEFIWAIESFDGELYLSDYCTEKEIDKNLVKHVTRLCWSRRTRGAKTKNHG